MQPERGGSREEIKKAHAVFKVYVVYVKARSNEGDVFSRERAGPGRRRNTYIYDETESQRVRYEQHNVEINSTASNAAARKSKKERTFTHSQATSTAIARRSIAKKGRQRS